jgi:hypothetical protein
MSLHPNPIFRFTVLYVPFACLDLFKPTFGPISILTSTPSEHGSEFNVPPYPLDPPALMCVLSSAHSIFLCMITPVLVSLQLRFSLI